MSDDTNWRGMYHIHKNSDGEDAAQEWMEAVLNRKCREIADLKRRLRKAKECLRWLAQESK